MVQKIVSTIPLSIVVLNIASNFALPLKIGNGIQTNVLQREVSMDSRSTNVGNTWDSGSLLDRRLISRSKDSPMLPSIKTGDNGSPSSDGKVIPESPKELLSPIPLSKPPPLDTAFDWGGPTIGASVSGLSPPQSAVSSPQSAVSDDPNAPLLPKPIEKKKNESKEKKKNESKEKKKNESKEKKKNESKEKKKNESAEKQYEDVKNSLMSSGLG